MDPSVGFVSHVGQLSLLALVVAGPLPVCLLFLRAREEEMADAPRGHALLGVFLVWSVAQIALGLLLGWMGRLDPVSLVLGEGLLLASGGALLRRKTRVETGGTPRTATSPPGAATAAAVFTVSVVGLSLAWQAITLCVRNFDSLAYHLPLVARWVEQGHFARFPELGQTARYPNGWELLSVLFFLPMREDVFIAIPNLLAWGYLGLALTLLSRRLGSSLEAALAGAVFVLTLPVMLDRIGAIQPDIGLTTFFVASLYFGLRAAAEGRGSDWTLFWISLALIAGSKTSGPGYAAIVVVAVALSRPRPGDVRWPSSGAGVRGRFRGAVLGWLGLGLFVGGFWYVRNLIQLGNPLGLLQVDVLGIEILRGSLPAATLQRTTLASIFEISRPEHWELLGRVAWDWLGLPMASLVLFAVAGATVAWARGRLRPRRVAVLGLLGVTTLLAYWHTPYSGDNGSHGWQLTPWIHVGLRYAFPFLSVMGVAASLGMTSLRLPVLALLPLPVLCAILGAVVELAVGTWALWVAVLLALGPALLLVAPARWRWSRVPTWCAVLALAAGAVVLTYFGRTLREADRVEAYGTVYRWMEENVGPARTIGYVNVQEIYPLWGRRWSRHVVGADPAPGGLRAWVSALRRRNVEVVAVGHAAPPPSAAASVREAQDWVRLTNGPFEMLRDYDSVRYDLALYRLRSR